MPDYNNNEGHISELFSNWPDADEEFDRLNIMSRKVTLTGNVFEDRLNLQISRNESRTFSRGPTFSSSGYSHGYEAGPSSDSQATPENSFEEDFPHFEDYYEDYYEEDDEEDDEEEFEEAVINAAREVARKYPKGCLFGDPEDKDYSSQRLKITIRDDFEGKILHFFQSRHEETACFKPGHMTSDTKMHLLAVIEVYQNWINKHKQYLNCNRTVTPAQKRLIEKLREMIIYADDL